MGAAAAVVMGGTGMDGIISGGGTNINSIQENQRRSSAPGTNSNVSGGLGSIFNFKSVINAATKTATAAAPTSTPQNVSSTSNFFVSTPPPVSMKPEPIVVDTNSPPIHAALPQKSIQGIFFCYEQAKRRLHEGFFLYFLNVFL
jgi:hypothetical protein